MIQSCSHRGDTNNAPSVDPRRTGILPVISRLGSALALCLVLGMRAAEPAVTVEPSPQPTPDTQLTIDITDLRNTAGSIRVSVYSTPDGFMKDASKACVCGVLKANAEKKELVFHLKPGTYAVALFHDQNDNGKLDTNFFGVPTEGYGVTNNPKPRFRAPKYTEALFDLPAQGRTATISLQYVG